jgi:serine/threonine protein kinase/tetratricopeptide (TPR) repeat protein
MEPERWCEIERLYHLALEQEAGLRSAFLARACEGDETLRQEVESLLAAGEGDDAFLEKPAMQLAGRARAQDAAPWNISGKKLSHYRVTEQIGAGGMGVVYLARDETLDRQVALKVLPPGSLADETARRRLRKEAKALAKLSHPNIETIYEFGGQDGIDFLVTEYVAGTTLGDRIANGPLPESELVDIAVQIGSALDEAASNGLVHLDLKPRNIMLTPKGQVKLLDFGLARIVRPNEMDATQSFTTMAAPAGTPPYMAPEQLLGGSLDVRTDIYAVGATLYELITGRAPFRAKTSPELIASILQTAAVPPSSTGASVSSGLEKVILKCLEKDPERRYQTVRELLADLMSQETVRAQTVTLPPRRAWFLPHAKGWLRPWRLAVLFLGVTGPILAVWLLLSRPVLSFAARDWVLVADFDNQTNDPLFDQSLLTAFSVSLEQSRHANIYPRSRIPEVLARMKRDAATRMDDAVGREIAVREGIRALILPSISGVGEDYRLAARIRDVASGIDVKTTVVKAHGKDQILDGLDQLASKVRGNLGESLLAISRNSRPLPAVTTASLAALKQYSIADQKRTEGLNLEETKLYFENALKIDPAFTAALTSLGMLDFEHFDKEEGKRLLSEAVRSAGNLTDREKYGLLAFHARAVEGNLEKAAGYHRILIGLYPDFAAGHNNLGIVYQEMGRYQEAVAEFKESLRIDPRLRIAFLNLDMTYFYFMGDFDAGIEACQKQIAQGGQYFAPFCYSWRGFAYLAKGKLEDAIRDLKQAAESAPRGAPTRFNLALAYSLSGQEQSAIKVLNEILATGPHNCDAHYDLGRIYNSMNDRVDARREWMRAADCWEEALRSETKQASNYLELAIARTRLGQTAEAQAAEAKARSIDPNLYLATARLRALQGRTDEALAYLERGEKNGLHDFGWVKLNPDLQSLSTQPRFVALLHRNLKGLDPVPSAPSH